MADVSVRLPATTRSAQGVKRMSRRSHEWMTAYLYLLPATIILAVFHFWPVFYDFWISLHRWPLSPLRPAIFLGLQNYQNVLSDPDFWSSLKVTVFYVVFTVPIQLVLALGLAYLLYQKIRGKGFFRVVFFLPYITSTVASSLVWARMFSPQEGPINGLLHLVGLPPQKWLLDPNGVFTLIGDATGIHFPFQGPSLALVSVMIFVIWFWVGYDAAIFLAGLGNIPTELYEAAKIDGASAWQLVRYVTIPLLSPTTFFLSLVAVIGAFQAFNNIYIMTTAAGIGSGGPLGTTTTVTMLTFRYIYEQPAYGYASAIAFILFFIILGLTVVQNYIGARRVNYI